MLKIKSPIKKLSAALALTLFVGPASALTVYDTYQYLFDSNGNKLSVPSGTETLSAGDWSAGLFRINSLDCPNGCDLTGASLLLDGQLYSPTEPSPFTGVTLQVFSNIDTGNGKEPNSSLFPLTTPAEVTFNGIFGTRVNFAATAQDPNNPALLQPGEEYWLRLSNDSQNPAFEWFFNGNNHPDQYWASSQFGFGSGSPMIFDVTGEARVSNVPVPAAAWMMGSGLIGLLAAARRKSTDQV
jgi:hypothetical protein